MKLKWKDSLYRAAVTGPSLDSYKCFPNSTLSDAKSREINKKIILKFQTINIPTRNKMVYITFWLLRLPKWLHSPVL